MAGIRKRKGEILVKLANTGELIPVAVYIRVSSIGQDVENSVDSQLQLLKQWAAENGYVIVKIFTDEVKSGRSGNRPNFQEMIRDAGEPDCPFEHVLVYKFSRFYRNSDESATYKLYLKKKGIRVISIKESGDDSAAGKLSETVLEAVGQYQSDITSEEVQRGSRHLAERGFCVAGRIPYGMIKIPVLDGKTDRYKMAPDEETEPGIRRIIDLALEGKTERQIRITVNQEGIPNASGKPWDDSRIHDVLSNVHIFGAIGWALRTDNPIITWGAHEGIGTKGEYDRIQKLLESRAPETSNPRNEGSEHPYSGKMRCRRCRAPYTYAPSQKDGKRYLYVVCKNRKDNGKEACDSPWVPAEVFEARAMAAIIKDVATRGNMASAIEELRAESGEEHDRNARKLEEADKRLKGVEARQDRMYAAYEGGVMDLERYTKRSQVLREMKEKIEAERRQIRESAGDRAIILSDPEAVLKRVDSMNKFLREEEPSKCKAWFKGFIKRIWIDHGKCTIDYTIPLPTDEQTLRTNYREFSLGGDFRPSTRVAPLSRE